MVDAREATPPPELDFEDGLWWGAIIERAATDPDSDVQALVMFAFDVAMGDTPAAAIAHARRAWCNDEAKEPPPC